jgi:protein-disulfide isomerase/uncharacterized membrane protein
MKRTKASKPLPFPFYFWTVVLLAVVGLLDSVYLSVSHYRVYTDMAYKSFCAISKAINCDTISQSPYSIFLNLPVPIWGIMGYTFLLLCLTGAARSKDGKMRLWSVIFWISLVFSGYSIVLAMISTYLIGSYCIMCIVSYGVNLALLFYAWIIRRRFSDAGIIEDTKKDVSFLWEIKLKSLALALVFCLAVGLTWVFVPTYWALQPPRYSDTLATGLTASGHPWIGSKTPILEITEFADYQCFQCKKMHFFLRQLVAAHPERIRLIHKHYPMDHQFNPIVKQPFHEGSGKMALLAVYAASKGKFWEMNDLLYGLAGSKGAVDIKQLAQKVAIDANELTLAVKHPKVRTILQRDILLGNKLAIAGTPTYVINNDMYTGHIPPEVFKEIIK